MTGLVETTPTLALPLRGRECTSIRIIRISFPLRGKIGMGVVHLLIDHSVCYGPLGPGFVNQVEWSFGGAAEVLEAALGHHLPHACFAGLGAQAQAPFLRA